MTTPRRRSLHLPLSSRGQRRVFRRRRQPPRWRQFGMGIVLITLAAVVLVALLALVLLVAGAIRLVRALMPRPRQPIRPS
jgi:hypothetical protein